MFVPTNMAVNFVQHNRCKTSFSFLFRSINNPIGLQLVNIEESGPPRKKRAESTAAVKPVSVPVELPSRLQNPGGKKEHDKASDDFYFEKFRRQFRR